MYLHRPLRIASELSKLNPAMIAVRPHSRSLEVEYGALYRLGMENATTGLIGDFSIFQTSVLKQDIVLYKPILREQNRTT